MALKDLGRGPFDVVAVTDKPERAHALVASLKWPLRLRLLQPPAEERPWRYRWFDSERYLLNLGQSLLFSPCFANKASIGNNRLLETLLHQSAP